MIDQSASISVNLLVSCTTESDRECRTERIIAGSRRLLTEGWFKVFYAVFYVWNVKSCRDSIFILHFKQNANETQKWGH
jgi:hypothetical protein